MIIIGRFWLLTLLQWWTQYFETFWYYIKFSFHHKWNGPWLLVINMVYTSCLTSCRENLKPGIFADGGGAKVPTQEKKKKTRHICQWGGLCALPPPHKKKEQAFSPMGGLECPHKKKKHQAFSSLAGLRRSQKNKTIIEL